MDSGASDTAVVRTVSSLAAAVRSALAEAYARPLVIEHADGVVVLAGRPLELARAAVEDAFGGEAARQIVALDVAALSWSGVPAAGLRLWRQHGLSGVKGELVTELEADDPPVQVVVEDDGWQLVRLLDGARGWIEAQELAPDDPPPSDVADARRIDVDGFVASLLGFEGVPYVWGGATAAGVDCSGIVQRAAWRSGRVWLPRHSRALLRAGARVAPAAAERGDVLVLQRDPRTVNAERAAQLQARAQEERRTGRVPAHGPAVHPMHVAVALSHDEVLHASRDAMRVVREPLESLRARYRVLGVRRFGDGQEPTA